MGKASYGGWQVLDSVGEGGQGRTFRVRHADGRVGIMKRLKNTKRSVRFEREVRALQQLVSARVPRLLGFGDEGGQPWIVMEDCGACLEKLLGADPPVERLLRWYRDVVLALRDSHAAGIIHRDIKPSNIAVSKDEESAFLVDFGICKSFEVQDGLTLADEPFGNPAFAAPECFLGRDKEPGPECDIYALGKLLFWLVGGGRHVNRERLRGLEEHIRLAGRHERARVYRLLMNTIVERPEDRLSAQALLDQAEALVAYIDAAAKDRVAGNVRLIDNFGTGENFDEGSGKEITSSDFEENDLAPHMKVSGRVRPGRALALMLENGERVPVRAYTVELGVRILTPDGRIRVSLVADEEGVPGDRILGTVEATVVGTAPRRLSLATSWVIWSSPSFVDTPRSVLTHEE
jgi:serine/threonine protein kinase